MKVKFAILIVMFFASAIILKSKKETIPNVTLENIEALASDESIYDYRKPKTVPCDYIEGSWHTASVRRDCVFSAVPSSCTAKKCGEAFN